MGFKARLYAMVIKEALQLRRDRLTFAMMFGTEYFIEPGRIAGMRSGWILDEDRLDRD